LNHHVFHPSMYYLSNATPHKNQDIRPAIHRKYAGLPPQQNHGDLRAERQCYAKTSSSLETKSNHQNLLNPSTPSIGTSTHFNPGTPSALRLSTKLLHSPTTSAHSANARPAYLALVIFSIPPFPSLGSLAAISRLVPGTLALSHA